MSRPIPSTEDRLADFLQPHIEPADVAALLPLQRARPALNALTTLFHGGEAAVMARLLVLREIAARGDAPFWTPAELRERLAYLDTGKLETILLRLRENELLLWDSETLRYQISPAGRMAIAAVNTLLKFDDEGSELGYLASQLAASGALRRVAADELQHLLSRLTELKDDFERAVLSGSESRIRNAEKRLAQVWDWVDKGTEVLQSITENDELDAASHRVAQRIGQVQSELLRMGGAFQRALNQLESQKVHLGTTGLSSSDVTRWLRTRSIDQLIGLIDAPEIVSAVPTLPLVLGDIALDIAEYELVDKAIPERIDTPLPPVEANTTATLDVEAIDFTAAEDFLAAMRVAPDGLPLQDAVAARDYLESSYRLSLLSVLGDTDIETLDGPLAALARLPRRPQWTGGIVQVARGGIAEMSAGQLTETEHGR
mgnify:CR=1 FL=1